MKKPKVLQIIEGKKGSVGSMNASQKVDEGKIQPPKTSVNKGQLLYKPEEGSTL